jgi:hypothetical protein
MLILPAGVIIFVVAFFGCCGAWQESSCMIYTYAALLTIILIGTYATIRGRCSFTVVEEKIPLLRGGGDHVYFGREKSERGTVTR